MYSHPHPHTCVLMNIHTQPHGFPAYKESPRQMQSNASGSELQKCTRCIRAGMVTQLVRYSLYKLENLSLLPQNHSLKNCALGWQGG